MLYEVITLLVTEFPQQAIRFSPVFLHFDKNFQINVITSYSIHYTKLYDLQVFGNEGFHQIGIGTQIDPPLPIFLAPFGTDDHYRQVFVVA